MKNKIINTIVCMLCISNLFGQFYNDGAEMTVQQGGLLRIDGDFINQGGEISNDGLIEIGGNWENTVMTNPLTPDIGLVQLVGSSQMFGGDFPTLFNDIALQDDQNVTLTTNIGIGNSININNGVIELNENSLHILNPMASAMMVSNGGVRAETSDNYGFVRWDIGVEDGQFYKIPFINNGDVSVPLDFEVTQAGQENEGFLLFTTYATAEDNTPLPIDVTNIDVNSDANGNNLVDRFWNIEAVDYTTVPLGTVGFSYSSTSEIGGANEISQESLEAINWDGDTQVWNVLGDHTVEGDKVTAVTNDAYGNFALWSNETNAVNNLEPFDRLTAYPNPASADLTIEIDGTNNEATNIMVVDVLGKVVLELNLDYISGKSTEQIDINTLPTGMYTIIIQSKTQRGILKFNKI